MSNLVWSDYFDNDREVGTGCKPAEHPDTMSAWFRYDAECKRQGLIPGSNAVWSVSIITGAKSTFTATYQSLISVGIPARSRTVKEWQKRLLWSAVSG